METIWTVTFEKSYCEIHFDFRDPKEAERFARELMAYVRIDEKPASITIHAEIKRDGEQEEQEEQEE